MPNGWKIQTTIAAQKTATTFADDRRKKIAEEQAEVNAEKARNLILQRSLDSSPESRIALWEVRHGLMLPSAADHPLMTFIAESTNLEPPQVEAEQQRRRELTRAGLPARGALTPEMDQDQLQTWEGEGGSTAPSPAPVCADVPPGARLPG